MARVLLVDTGFSAAPLHDHLVSSGHDVLVVGRRPDDALVRSGARFAHVDYADTDALEALVRQEAIERVIPGCTDVSLRSAARVAADTGLPFPDTPAVLEDLLDKGRFRMLCAELDLPAPTTLTRDAATGRDVVVKPVMSYSGRGITVLQSARGDDLDAAIAVARGACANDGHVIESFAPGQLYSHSAIVVDHRIVWEVWVHEDGSADPLSVDTSFVAQPGDHASRRVRDAVEQLAAARPLGDGLVHSQVLVDGDDIVFVEVTRRCPGDRYADLVRLSTGVPYAALYCAAYLGEPPTAPAGTATQPVLRLTLTPDHDGIVDGVTLPADLPPTTIVQVGRTGDRQPHGAGGRYAVAFLACRDAAERDALRDRAMRRALYTTATPTGGARG